MRSSCRHAIRKVRKSKGRLTCHKLRGPLRRGSDSDARAANHTHALAARTARPAACAAMGGAGAGLSCLVVWLSALLAVSAFAPCRACPLGDGSLAAVRGRCARASRQSRLRGWGGQSVTARAGGWREDEAPRTPQPLSAWSQSQLTPRCEAASGATRSACACPARARARRARRSRQRRQRTGVLEAAGHPPKQMCRRLSAAAAAGAGCARLSVRWKPGAASLRLPRPRRRAQSPCCARWRSCATMVSSYCRLRPPRRPRRPRRRVRPPPSLGWWAWRWHSRPACWSATADGTSRSNSNIIVEP